MTISYLATTLALLSIFPIAWSFRSIWLEILFRTITKYLSKDKSMVIKGIRYSYKERGASKIVDVNFNQEIGKSDISYDISNQNMNFEYLYRGRSYTVVSESSEKGILIIVKPN